PHRIAPWCRGSICTPIGRPPRQQRQTRFARLATGGLPARHKDVPHDSCSSPPTPTRATLRNKCRCALSIPNPLRAPSAVAKQCRIFVAKQSVALAPKTDTLPEGVADQPGSSKERGQASSRDITPELANPKSAHANRSPLVKPQRRRAARQPTGRA